MPHPPRYELTVVIGGKHTLNATDILRQPMIVTGCLFVANLTTVPAKQAGR
jgi:hypothetical protein